MKLTRKVNGQEADISVAEQVSIEAEGARNAQKAIDNEAANGWKLRRIAQYAAMGTVSDQLDIIQKQFQSMIDLGEVTVLPETQAWLAAIDQIKAANPKPAE